MNGDIVNRNETTVLVEAVELREVVREESQVGVDVVDGRRREISAVNLYNSKKSAAEGMMDISLLTANANQLKFILYYNQESKTFYPALVLIILSLILQVAVGFLLIFRVSVLFLYIVLCVSMVRAIHSSDIILIVITTADILSCKFSPVFSLVTKYVVHCNFEFSSSIP